VSHSISSPHLCLLKPVLRNFVSSNITLFGRDSLEKFTGVAHSDSEEDSSSQELFHFRSPPKAAAKPLPKPDTAAKRHLNRYHNDSINHWSQHANNDYTPSKYSKPETSPTRQLNPIEAKPPRAQVSDIMQPRPPDSPSPRPGSGRLRSRNNSRANSRNNSNKPTPESSGTGEDLCGHLTTDTVKDSPRRKPLMAGEEFDGVPSPRTSDKGPRISSGNSASRASASSVESSNSDRLQPPNVSLHLESNFRGAKTLFICIMNQFNKCGSTLSPIGAMLLAHTLVFIFRQIDDQKGAHL